MWENKIFQNIIKVRKKQKILVFGLGKSGTSGLYYKIKNSLPDSTRCLFEPREYVKKMDDIKTGVLAKILLAVLDYSSLKEFNKKIYIIRDLRDQILSGFLYKQYHSQKSKDEISFLIEKLREKEKAPSSLSCVEIFKYERKYIDEILWNIRLQDSFIREYSNEIFILKYEDFIDQKLESLEKYLGFQLKGSADVHENLQRVVRTKSYNNWKNWFTKEDIKYFKPLLCRFMRKLGYEDNWEINQHQKILAEHCSEYVLKLLKEKNC